MTALETAPIRVAFCITELEPGGAERCLVELVKRLDRRRFRPVVYCLGPRPASNPTSLADELDGTRAPLHFFDAAGWLDAPRVLRQLRKQMMIDQPAILQGFLFHANLLGTIAAHRAGVPHILTGIRVAERRARWHLTLAWLASRWVERHVCVSQSVLDFSRTQGRLPEQKLVVIRNGVDVGRFTASPQAGLRELRIAAGRRIIVHVGRLDAQKGVSWLLDLMPGVLRALPQHDLVLVGEGPERGALEAQSRQLGIGTRVHFVGYRREVPETLGASDVLVLASQWEGMPNVILEAMAAGKPVVATDVEGVREALGPGAPDQIVSPREPALFASKLIEILKNPGFAANLGEANRQRAKQELSLDRMAEAYQRLYQSLAVAP